MGHFATQTLNVDQVVIAASQSPYAKGIQQVFRQEFERNGGKVLDVIEYPRNTSDLGGVLDRIMTLKPARGLPGGLRRRSGRPCSRGSRSAATRARS